MIDEVDNDATQEVIDCRGWGAGEVLPAARVYANTTAGAKEPVGKLVHGSSDARTSSFWADRRSDRI